MPFLSLIWGILCLTLTGNIEFRHAAILHCVVHLKEFAANLKHKGKHTMVIIGALMRKLLHIIFGVLKNKTPFNPHLMNLIT